MDTSTLKIFSCNNIKPPVEGRCGYFVKRKQRFCKMMPPKGQTYCAEHLFQENNQNDDKRKRILCPLDKKHSIYEDNIDKHLKKCNAAIKIQLPYFEKDINIGLKSYSFNQQEQLNLSEVPVEILVGLIERVKKCFLDISNQPIKESFSLHPIFNDELNIASYGTTVKKHLLQQASLIKILEDMDCLNNGTSIIEFGAGKGSFSHWVQKTMSNKNDVSFYLVDRQSNRNKFDCYHKGELQGPRFQRLNIDIQHLNLEKVESLCNSSQNIVGIGKHVCGAATDLSLNCLFDSSSKILENEEPPKKRKTNLKSRVHSCLFALCCYHCCTWPTYVGRDFFIRKGFTAYDFNIISKMVGWATCGFSRRKMQNESEALTNDVDRHNFENCVNEHSLEKTYKEEDIKLKLTSEEQEEIGRICKRMIDFGRIEYVNFHGYNAQLVYYINNSITPENIALKITKH
ncbi:tRNA:m(4)X modification enzyme TRM13 homolog isoform X2 [Hydra vulgaris]|uniref:tRNA:m(4)X modification enzyme TRM13 n=1 Tax=Hydra vulgaris TaxID=6087 RepID=A0ABM4DDK3_HYDVU